jgi:hypothetical protein
LPFEFKLQVKPNGNRVKSIFIRGKVGMDLADIVRVAKSEAWKIGMGYVEVLDVVWSENAGGWSVVIQNKS